MPRIFGHDLLAVIAAAVAIYAVGFIVYGLLFSDMWMAAYGYTEDSFVGHEWKFALSPLMPILTAACLAALLNMTGASGLGAHLKLGFFAWLGFQFTALMYTFAYGVFVPASMLALDGAHLLIGTLVGAAVLTWRK